jgi:hypothetical protein
MAVQVEDVLNTARMFLNDLSTPIQLWTDTILMPMYTRAHQELQVILRQRAAPVMKASTTVNLASGQTSIPSPSDLIAPIQLWEGFQLAVGTYASPTLMTEVDLPFPIVAPTLFLRLWSWDGNVMTTTGATTTKIVFLSYWRSLPLPTLPVGTQTLIIPDGEMWLAPRTAAIAAASVGEEATSAAAASNAATMLEAVVLANRGRAPQQAGASIRP